MEVVPTMSVVSVVPQFNGGEDKILLVTFLPLGQPLRADAAVARAEAVRL